MFILVPNSMAMVHSQSSNAPSRRPWISRSYSSPARDECSQPPSSVQGSCHSPLPISSRTRSRDLLPDTDQIVFSVRLNTEEDPEYDPKAAGEELEGRRIAPIGSQRPQSQAQPPSPAVPLPVAESSQTAYFPPPGLVRGEPPSRPASTPPESWNRSSTPSTQPDSDKSRLLALLEDEFESKFVDMKQFRGDGSKDKSQRQPEDKNKGTDNAQDQGGECSPAERKKSGRATPRQRPFFGCVPSLPVHTTTTPANSECCRLAQVVHVPHTMLRPRLREVRVPQVPREPARDEDRAAHDECPPAACDPVLRVAVRRGRAQGPPAAGFIPTWLCARPRRTFPAVLGVCVLRIAGRDVSRGP